MFYCFYFNKHCVANKSLPLLRHLLKIGQFIKRYQIKMHMEKVYKYRNNENN